MHRKKHRVQYHPCSGFHWEAWNECDPHGLGGTPVLVMFVKGMHTNFLVVEPLLYITHMLVTTLINSHHWPET